MVFAIVVLIIVLLVAGVFYFKTKRGGDVVLEDNTPVLPDNTVQGGRDSLAPAPVAEDITAKFNAAMDRARAAFLKKDYAKSIASYQEALTYRKTDTPYSGLFVVYGAQGEWAKALEALDAALKINSFFDGYWKSKIEVLSEQTSAGFADLLKVYNEGMLKVDPRYKVNLVTFFAGIAEKYGQKDKAVSLWQEAIKLYPQNTSSYQAEIERLQNPQKGI